MVRRLLDSPSTRLGALQLSVLCVSLFSQVFIARHFGVGHQLDGYYAVLGTALGVMGSLSVATNYVLPPEIVRAIARSGAEAARHAAAEHGFRILCWIIATALFGGLGMLIARALGSSPAGAPDASMIIVGWLVAAGSAVAGLIGAISTSHRRVTLPLAASALPPAMLLLSFSIWTEAGVALMLVGMLIGTSVQCLALGISIRGLVTWRPRWPSWSFRDNMQLLVAAAGAACFSSYSVIDAFVAPGLGAGALTLQALAQRLTVAFGTMLSAGAFALAPDNFGRLVEDGRRHEALRLFHRTSASLVALTLLACVAMPWAGNQVLQILFAGGNFQAAVVDRLAMITTILLIGTGAMLSSAIGFRFLYALSAGDRVARTSLVWLALYLLLALAFVEVGLAHALAWAYVAAWWTIFGWLTLSIGRIVAAQASVPTPRENR